MKKKVVGLIVIIVAVLSVTSNVFAEGNVYYTTPNGIELTRDEYIFLTTFFWDGYPDIMTEAQYKEFKDLDLVHREIHIKKSGQTDKTIGPVQNNPRGTYHYQNGRSLQIGAACDNTTCYNSILAIWSESPNVRSYDVIGAYITNATLISHQNTFVYSTSGMVDYLELMATNHGLGNTVKLPTVGENILINMTFTSTKNGRIYGSYQHAMSFTTVNVSQDYTFSLGGYGNVFDFGSSALGVYDATAGVDIDI